MLNSRISVMASWYGDVKIDVVYEYDIDSTSEQLDEWCKDCNFVFNLAGVNRPQDPKEFMEGKNIWYKKPDAIFPLDAEADAVIEKAEALFA